ncbi:hypothetical protein BDZ91DRAFT_95631 [Kalaharituber pfeilii]|nr:hypothetical protein BDZ91DRAFT_95631 [Kalaharituber pfeilii]
MVCTYVMAIYQGKSFRKNQLPSISFKTLRMAALLPTLILRYLYYYAFAVVQIGTRECQDVWRIMQHEGTHVQFPGTYPVAMELAKMTMVYGSG